MVAVNPNNLRGSHTVEESNRRMTTHFKPTTRFSVFLPGDYQYQILLDLLHETYQQQTRKEGSPCSRQSDPTGVTPGEIPAPLHLLAQGTWGQTRSGTGDKDRWAGGAAWALHPQHCCPVPCFQEDPSYNEHWPSLKVDECSVCMTHMH